MNHELTLIGVWDGDYVRIVGLLCEVNPELRIRIQRQKLIIKSQDFYRCLPIGEEIKVPRIYESDRTIPITTQDES